MLASGDPPGYKHSKPYPNPTQTLPKPHSNPAVTRGTQASGDGLAWLQTTAADGSECVELKIMDLGQPWKYTDR